MTPGTTTTSEVFLTRNSQAGWNIPQRVDGPSAAWPSLNFDLEGAPWLVWENGSSSSNLSIRVKKMVENAQYVEHLQLYRPKFANSSLGPPVILTIDPQTRAAQVVTRQ
jgi:hypothetical protein